MSYFFVAISIMQLLVLFVLFFSAIPNIEGKTICAIARAQVTDTQIAAWKSMLTPIRVVIEQIDRARVIASPVDFSIEHLGPFKQIPWPQSFKDGVMKNVYQDVKDDYWRMRCGPHSRFDSPGSIHHITDFNKDLANFLSAVRTNPPNRVKEMSASSRNASDEDLAGLEKIIGWTVEPHASAGVLWELSNLQARLKRSAAAADQADITHPVYILTESLRHLKRAFKIIAAGHTRRFVHEISFRVREVRRRFSQLLEFVDKAMDAGKNQQPSVAQMLECMSFRLIQEFEYMKAIAIQYNDFCQNHAVLDWDAIETTKENYQSALEAIGRKTVEAGSKIEGHLIEATNRYNAWLDKAVDELSGGQGNA